MPTVENKVLERAVAMLLEPVYEREFLDCSYGFPAMGTDTITAFIRADL